MFITVLKKSLSLVPIMSVMNPVHIAAPYFFKINFNIIIPYKSKSSKWSPPFSYSDQISVVIRPHLNMGF